MKIEFLILIGFVVLGVIRILGSVKNAKVTPDPWSPEIEESLRQPEAVPVCHRCFTPQSDTAWFCPHCGTAVGKYNNVMPYISVFSQGEVLRAGATDRIRRGFLTSLGYFFVSLNYYFFAPVYWFFLSKNFRKHRATEDAESI